TDKPAVYLLALPPQRSDADASRSGAAFAKIAAFCTTLHPEATVCLLTTPADAARLLPVLEEPLKFQLSVGVKAPADAQPTPEGQLPARHVTLMVLTRYRGSLRHTKTRIRYTFCPACGKTTKDYGGKKHVYHEYGTLMADIWRDICCDPSRHL